MAFSLGRSGVVPRKGGRNPRIFGIWLWILGAFSCLCASADNPPAPRIPAEAEEEISAKEVALRLGPVARAEGDALVIDATTVESFVVALDPRALFRPSLRLRGRLLGPGALVLAVGASPSGATGLEIALEAGSRTLTLKRLGARAEDALELKVQRRAESLPFALFVEESRLRLQVEGEAEKSLTIPREWRVGDGRLFVGGRGGSLRVEEFALSAEIGPVSRRRAVARSRRAPVQEPPQRPLPWAGPLERFDRERFLALAQGAPERAEQILAAVQAGELERARALSAAVESAAPEALAARFLEGLLELEIGLEPYRAEGALAAARQVAPHWPDAAILHGDALALLGRFEEAEAAYADEPDPGRRAGALAFAAWARGDFALARQLREGAEAAGCRRAAARLRLLDELDRLEANASGFARHSKSGITVLSDLDAAAARRAHSEVRPALHALSEVLRLKADTGPLLILLLDDAATYDLWNGRLGGIRLGDSLGIYRPGTRTIFLLDDDDERVMKRRLRHELVHHLLHTNGVSLPPLFEEGLSEWLANGEIEGGRLRGLSNRNPARFRVARALLASGRAYSVEELFSRQSQRFGRSESESYALSWAVVHALTEREGPSPKSPFGALSPVLDALPERRDPQAILELIAQYLPQLEAQHLLP